MRELYSIILPCPEPSERLAADSFIVRLEQELSRLHSTLRLQIIRQSEERIGLRIGAETAGSTKGISGKLLVPLAGMLAAYVMESLEGSNLRRMIRRANRDLPPAEVDKVLQYCEKCGKASSPVSAGDWPELRKRKLAEELTEYLACESGQLDLSGFLEFRAVSYREELGELVEYGLDEWTMEQQYQEFIQLLKYFVFIQETKMPEVHIMHLGDHEFVLLDGNLKPMDSPKPERILADLSEGEVQCEDLIVSALISLSPKRLIIHTRNKEAAVIQTLGQIFDERVELCECCAHCEDYLALPHASEDLTGGAHRVYNKSP